MSTDSVRFPPFAALTLASAFWGIATVISKALLTSIPPMLFLIVTLWIVLKNFREAMVFFGFLVYVVAGVLGQVTRPVWRKQAPEVSSDAEHHPGA